MKLLVFPRNKGENFMYKVLIVEDDESIRELIKLNLTMVGYDVFTSEDGDNALKILANEKIDLALLDIMLPRLNGFEILEKINKDEVGVIFITAKNSTYDKVKGLKLGADDYLVKPFESIELLARIESVLRRKKPIVDLVKFKHISVNTEERTVKCEDEIIHLTVKEFELLLLLKNKNIALTRDQILEHVWGYDFEGGTRTVDMHIQRLRDKLLLKDYIKTVYKIGYRIEDM